MKTLRTRLTTGFLLLLPLGITYFIVRFIFDTLDGIFGPPIARYSAVDIPGMGFVTLILLAFVLGLVAASRPGQAILARGERALAAMPMIGSLYKAAKSVSMSFNSDGTEGFSTVVRVNYPNEYTHSLGFLVKRLDDDWVIVYLPSTPMPNTGTMIMVKTDRLVKLPMSSARAMQLVMSAGATAVPGEFAWVTKQP